VLFILSPRTSPKPTLKFRIPLFFLKAFLLLPLFFKDKAKENNVGGQAVLEGVMMRGPKSYSVATRLAGGETTLLVKEHIPWTKRRKILGLPFLRGVAVLFESLIIGYKSLAYSAAVLDDEMKRDEMKKGEIQKGEIKGKEGKDPEDSSLLISDATPETLLPADKTPADKAKGPDPDLNPNIETNQEDPSSEKSPSSPNPPSKGSSPEANLSLGFFPLAFTLICSFGLAILLFVALPHFLSLLIGKPLGLNEENVFFHITDGVIKFGIFLSYVWLIGKIPDIGRVFAYHGAEHKAIYTHENKLPLEPSYAKAFPLWHPRCGTAFIFLLLAISVLFFSIVFPLFFSYGGTSSLIRALYATFLKTLLMFPLAALSYEITKKAGAPGASFFWKAVISPGLLLQKLTTREPDDAQLEVAFKALSVVLPGADEDRES
jgi:uncharacterized protein YqhQ